MAQPTGTVRFLFTRLGVGVSAAATLVGTWNAIAVAEHRQQAAATEDAAVAGYQQEAAAREDAAVADPAPPTDTAPAEQTVRQVVVIQRQPISSVVQVPAQEGAAPFGQAGDQLAGGPAAQAPTPLPGLPASPAVPTAPAVPLPTAPAQMPATAAGPPAPASPPKLAATQAPRKSKGS